MEKLEKELVERGYQKVAVGEALDRVKVFDRALTLEKVERTPSGRPVLVIPFDKRMPGISRVLKHRGEFLVSRDPKVRDYMPKPPMVCYTRTKNFRDILVRAKVPPSKYRQERRQVRTGFRKCGKRVNCCVCPYSTNTTTHTCNHTR